MLQCGQHNLDGLVLHHHIQVEEAGGGVQVLHVQVLHVQVGEHCCDRGHGWRWVQQHWHGLDIFSPNVPFVDSRDRCRSICHAVVSLGTVYEGIELCVGEGTRRGLRILQVACWTPSLVAKCLSISVLSEATDVFKGELTRYQVFVGLDLGHKSDHLQCLVEFFLLLEQGKLVLVVAISQQQVLDDLGFELEVVHSGCGKSFAALDDRETHLSDVLSGELLRLQTSHFLLHVFELFHGVALEGLNEQHPNLQEARFVRDAILNLPFQGLVQAVHEHQAGSSVVGSIVGVILGVLDGRC